VTPARRQPELLTSTEVALRLGVTAATVKRWADGGLLACARTAGRHRRFDAEVVERFRRERGGEAAGVEPRFAERLLSEDDALALQAELLAERARRGAWWRVAEWLGPELEELGVRWEDGRIGILEEHLAADRLARALARCGEALPVRPDAPRILLAPAEGEEHLLGLALADLVLREGGWRTVWSGRAVPAAEIVRQVEGGAIDAVALSASAVAAPGVLAAEARTVGEACRRAGATLIAGGRGPWPAPLPHGTLERSFEGLRAWMAEREAGRRSAR
jgi:excisionase family DNA binding protein